jgi:hypothetical protein
MAQLLAGARKYGLGLILAHQDLRQLETKAPEVASALLGNAGTRIAFRVGDRDAKALSEGLSFFGPADLMSLRVGEAIARIDNSQGDCNLKTRLLPVVPAEVATERREAVTLRSRERYAVRREEPQRVAQPAREVPAPAVEPEAEVEVPPRVEREAPPAPVAERKPLEPPPRPALPPAPKREARPEPPPLGRGGPEHQYLQELVKRWGESHGYRATIEEPLPRGGRADVALRSNDFSLACEISVTSTVEQEVGNALKCLKAGFQEVAILALKRPRLRKIEAALKAKLSESDLARVHLVSPEELFAMLSLRPKVTETVVGGYKVTVRKRTADPDEEAIRYRALSEVIGKSLRRMASKEKP